MSRARAVVVHVHLTPVFVDVGRGCGGSVEPVILAATATGEPTDSSTTLSPRARSH